MRAGIICLGRLCFSRCGIESVAAGEPGKRNHQAGGHSAEEGGSGKVTGQSRGVRRCGRGLALAPR